MTLVKNSFPGRVPHTAGFFYLRDSDLVCDTCDFSMEKNSQRASVISEPEHFVSVSALKSGYSTVNILISFQHYNYIDYYSPQSTSPGNCTDIAPLTVL